MTAVFDSQWQLTTSNCTNDVTILGNGKIGLISGSRSNVISKVFISSQVNEQTQNNMIEIFNTHSISLSNYNVNNTSNFTQSLNMYCGILTTSMIYSGSNLPDLLVSSDVYVPQHLPFCTVQTVNISYANSYAQSNCMIDVFHTISGTNLCKPRYNNATIFNQINNNGIYILTGEANVHDENIVTACTYSFSSLNTNKGFNISSSDTKSAFNIFNIRIPSSFSIIASHMTKYDFFKNPLEEVKKIVLRVLNEGSTLTRSKHVSAWSDQWANTNLTIQPKDGITLLEKNKVTMYNRNLKYSLYNIFSCTRKNDDGNSFGIINIPYNYNETGGVLYTGDLFLVPVLLLLCPDNAKSFLTYRYKTLSLAKQFAAGYGFMGAKYPYSGETVGYNTLYWNTYSQFTIFNTALISINIWNYYRSKLDKAWLQNVGFPVLQENAEFFISCIKYDSNTGIYSINNSVGLSGIVSESNNIFTNNTVKLALRFAIEAGYELSVGANDKWNEYFYGLPLLTYQTCHCPDGIGNVYKFDTNYNLSTSSQIPVAEPLLLFIPCYQTPNNGQFSNISVSGIPQNVALISTLNAYYNKVTNWNNPINAMIIALSYGIYSQTCESSLPQFITTFDNFISTQTSSVWGNMQDLTVYALFLEIILQGVIGLKIYGGVAESRFYYEEIKTTSNLYANMPNTWRSITVTRAKINNTTTNQCTYP